MKEISIIIPCYNTANYLGRCMDSLVRQTLGIENMELILVNDASTDKGRTWNAILEWEERYPESVMAINLTENCRQGGARNVGMKYASAEYIGFVDSDDWVEYNMYEVMLEEIKDSQGDIVYCKSFRDTGKGPLVHKCDGSYQRINIDSEEKRKQFIAGNCIGYGVWDKVYRKSYLLDCAIEFPSKLMYEDLYFTGMQYLYAKRVSMINYELYHYFVNEESTTLTKNALYHLDILEIAERKVLEYKTRGMWDKYREELEFEILSSGYLAALKILFLRFDRIPYEKFVRLQDMVRTNMPQYYKNPYIDMYLPDTYKVLLDVFRANISEKELDEIAKQYRVIANA